MATIDELIAKYGNDAPSQASADTFDVDHLISKYGSDEIKSIPTITVTPKSTVENISAGLKQGVNNVINTGANAIGFVDKKLFPGGEKRNENFQERLKKSNEDYKTNYGDSNAAYGGELAGETLATLPLIPAKAIRGINIASHALPTVLSTGERIAAPLINRLGAAAGTGALSGGIFGAATSGGNDDSLAKNVGTGIITGALAGPAIMAGGSLAASTVNGFKSAWEHVNVDKLARSAGLATSAVKDIITRLQNAGLTPQTAQAELNKLGPKATLMDLEQSLADEGGAIAALGDKSSNIMKNRLLARADTANSDAVKVFENKFGPKPDLELEKQNVVNQARALTKADYEAAHASTNKLDISGVVSDIDKSLENAVGRKASALKEVKSYLFKTVKDAEGNPKTILKDDVSSLHEVRQGVDDLIKNKGDSLPPSANRAINQVRNSIDEVLKTNPQMKAADEKFAEKMKIADGLQIGNEVITKGMNKEEFGRLFNAASPEVQETIKKGMRAAVGNLMEKNTQGELSGAQRLFDKKALNRANFKTAFGADADSVLDALHQEIAFRNTERSVLFNSKTAERQAIQARRAGEGGGRGGLLGEALKGIAIDASTGALGAATAVNVTKTGGRNLLLNLSEGRLNRLNEGSADLLSRSGSERDNALRILNQVSTVQNKSLLSRQKTKINLPITFAGPLGNEGYKKLSE